MKKNFESLLKFFENRKKSIEKQLINSLSEDEKKAVLLEENSSVEAIINAIKAMPEDGENQIVTELKNKVNNLETAIEENSKEFQNQMTKLVEKSSPKTFINFVKKAVEDKIFENSKGNTSIGITRFVNDNGGIGGSGVLVVYNDTEVGVKPSTVPTLLDYVRQISLGNQNAVAWNEIDGTEDASAIVAVGDDKPIKTFAHSYSVAATDTIAVISKMPKQFAKAISMLADLYLNDMMKDITRKLNRIVVNLVAEGSDLSDLMPAIPAVKSAQIIDAIRIVAAAIRKNHPESRVIIGLSEAALFELDSVKDGNDNYITYDFAQKGIVLVSLPEVEDLFTTTSILGMSENVVRWYNDGIDNLVTDQRYWDTNEIGLMVEVLNSVFVLRASDATATCFDDYKTIIEDMDEGIEPTPPAPPQGT